MNATMNAVPITATHSNIFLRLHSNIKIVALEPDTAAYYSKGQKNGKHHVEGIGLGFTLPLLNKNNYNEARCINEQEARMMARQLAKKEGIFGGTSTGLNVVGALQLAKELGNQRISRFNKGDKLDSVITELDKEKRKVSLSIKALEEKNIREAEKKFGSRDSGGVLGEILGPLLNKKKKNKK